MNTFAETAIVDYRLPFAHQGKQTSVFRFCFPFSVCSKQTEVAVFRSFNFPFAGATAVI
jgi:hypothetical protein